MANQIGGSRVCSAKTYAYRRLVPVSLYIIWIILYRSCDT